MKDGAFWRLGTVSDTQLRDALGELLASGSRTEARIIAHLAELETHKIHLEDGSESLYAYCIHVLRLSNSEAFYRITAARIARRFPEVFTLVEQRQLHLTAVCLLRDYLTPENHEELLRAAAHKTKWQIQELLAKRFPRPDVESRIRKLPHPRAVSHLVAAHGSDDATTQPDSAAEPSSRESALPMHLARAGELAQPAELAPIGGANVTWAQASRLGSRATPTTHLLVERRTAAPPQIEPLSESRYRIQLNASGAFKGKLDRMRALISHSNPTGDLAIVIERALEIAIEQVEKQRFAKTDQPRCGAQSGVEKRPRPTTRKHVPNAVRREIALRDELRCSYLASNGQRCTARAFLQIHHEHPWARGGGETVSNLRLLCGPHNRLIARRDFGSEHVATQMQKRLARTRQK